jgi:hypothetical protein
MYKTIHIMLPSEITERANVLYSFSNFMKDVQIDEDSENIVTVMQCNGENCDISGVNPMGTSYICDFSYYMDADGRWMSSDLKTKINAWKTVVDNNRQGYRNKVLQLRTAYENREKERSSLQEISRIYTDLAAAVARRSVAMIGGSSVGLHGIVWAESVNDGEKSLDTHSSYHSTAFNVNSGTITCYKTMPTFNSSTKTWSFSGSGYTGTPAQCYSHDDGSYTQFLYFIDASDNKSYCRLEGTAKINASTFETE